MNYNFEIFIEGYSNKFLRSVVEVVVENLVKIVFNLLFFYGVLGVGKIYLVNVIGICIKELYLDKRVFYVLVYLF